MLVTLILRLGISLAKILPPRVLSAALAGLWRLVGRFSPRRRILEANLAAVAAAGGAKAASGDVFSAYGRYWADLLALAARPQYLASLPIRVEGEGNLARAAAHGSVCVLSAHLGSWDILSYWLASRLPGITFLMERLQPPPLFALFVSIREGGGARILAAEGAGPRLFRRLRKGGHAGFIADRVFGLGAEQGEGVRELPFLGGARRLPLAGLELARRAGAALLPIFLLREDRGYVIKIYPDVAAAADPLAAYAARLEVEILARPEQWCVLYPLHDGEAHRRGARGSRVRAMKGAAAR